MFESQYSKVRMKVLDFTALQDNPVKTFSYNLTVDLKLTPPRVPGPSPMPIHYSSPSSDEWADGEEVFLYQK